MHLAEYRDRNEEREDYAPYYIIDENGERHTPQEPPPSRKAVGAGSAIGIGAALLFLLSKGKGLLFALKYGKFFGTAVSMFVMIGSYAMFYGWRYAVGIVLMIAIHELGHVVFAKGVGMPVTAPVFIPFVGAFISMKEAPKDAWQEAVVALGGPLFGLVAALVAFGWGVLQHSGLLLAVAYFGFFITLFNMIPVSPLDGGRIVTALSPAIWIAGLVIMAVAAWYTFSPLMLIILLLGALRARRTWRDRHDPLRREYYRVAPAKRWAVGIGYGLLTAISGFGVYLFTGS